MNIHQITALVEHSATGDTEAFTELYRMTNNRVYFICLSLLKNEYDAKDAVQDTYLTAYKNIRQLAEPNKFQAWIERIAANRCKNILKRKTPIPTEDSFFEELLSENELSLPEKYIVNAEKRRIIMDIIRYELSDLQYQTVILYYFNNLTIAEVAEIMECSEGAVKNRLSVSRTKIKKAVETYEKDNDDKLFVLVGVPFLSQLLNEECKNTFVPDLSAEILSKLNTIGASADSGFSKTTEIIQNTRKTGAKVMKGKIIAMTIAVAVAGTVGGIIAVSMLNKDTVPTTPEITSNTSVALTESFEHSNSDSSTNANHKSVESSQEESSTNYVNDFLGLYDFDIDGLNGNIREIGGTSSNDYIFVVTNDNKVYLNDMVFHFSEYTTLNSDFKTMQAKTTGGGLTVENTDGSYTLYSAVSPNEKSVHFRSEEFAVAAYSDYLDILNIYTVKDGKLLITIIDGDGKVLKENRPVQIDEGGAELTSQKVVTADNIKNVFPSGGVLAVQKNDGTLYYCSLNQVFLVDTESVAARNGTAVEEYILKTNSNYGKTENTDKILGNNRYGNVFYSLTGDDTKIYTTDSVSLNTAPDTIPVPDGYSANDIKNIYCSSNNIYIVMNDGTIFTGKNESENTKWKLAKGLTEMNKSGKIKNIGICKFDLVVLCDDDTVYAYNNYDLYLSDN